MKSISFTNKVAIALQLLGHVSWIAGVLCLLSTFNKASGDYLGIILPVICCVINCVFMFGFAYVVEACSLYIKKHWAEEIEKRVKVKKDL